MTLPSYPELVKCVETLKLRCGDSTVGGAKRRQIAIARSYQRYLITGFFVYTYIRRLRILRELELGKTLRKIDGRWKMTLWDADTYKTFHPREAVTFEIPDILYPELEEWINNQRQFFKPQHNYIFTNTLGQPYDSRALGRIFRNTVYFETGKLCSPHQIFYIKSKLLSQDNLLSICGDEESRGKKRIRGEGVFGDKVKKNYSIAIRASLNKKIDLKARELSLSRSEFLETLALNFEKLDFSCIASGE